MTDHNIRKLNKLTKAVLVIVLCLSGIFKIIDPKHLIELLDTLNFFPDLINIIISIGLPVLEISLACIIYFHGKSKLTDVGIIALFFFFFVFSIYGYVTEIDKDCGCFGNLIPSSFGILMIIRNFLFLLIAISFHKTNQLCN